MKMKGDVRHPVFSMHMSANHNGGVGVVVRVASLVSTVTLQRAELNQ